MTLYEAAIIRCSALSRQKLLYPADAFMTLEHFGFKFWKWNTLVDLSKKRKVQFQIEIQRTMDFVLGVK